MFQQNRCLNVSVSWWKSCIYSNAVQQLSVCEWEHQSLAVLKVQL